MRTILHWLCLLATMSFAATAFCADEEVVGYVKTAAGESLVITSGKSVKAEPGAPVQVGSVLKTGKQGSLGLTFKDNTIISIGPDTEVSVDEYLYAPAKGELKLGASMLRGTLNYSSGIIAKLKPEGVSLKTPTGNIGVRGTHFVVMVAGD